ncbi:MAG: transporter [Acidobacteriota bacterium]|nr:transporter [Acidobacteriota bacterium]
MLLLWQTVALAQQPFLTDDADVTEHRKLHFEFSNEFDFLNPSASPNLRQNTSSFELNYGIFKNVEIGIECPLITIFNEKGTMPQTPFGIGDTNFSIKYNFLKEQEGKRHPAMSLSFNLEIPTGDVSKQLGSGVEDFFLNYILQKSLSETLTLRANSGVILSGNTLTGVIGINTRGLVLTGGSSLVKEITPKLQLGGEVFGAVARNANLGKGQLQLQFGGNYFLRDNLSLDFGLIVGGNFPSSPRVGLQLGFSVDF